MKKTIYAILIFITACIVLLHYEPSFLLIKKALEPKPPAPLVYPGKKIERSIDLQRQLLETNDKGYLVQDFYVNRPYTSPFIIKNKADLTKGVSSTDVMATYYDLIGSVEGPIDFYWANSTLAKQASLILKANYKAGKREGQWNGYYMNGQLAYTEFYQQGILEGKQQKRYLSGHVQSEYTYKQGKLEGYVNTWYENGQKISQQYFEQDLQEGDYRYWYETGQLQISGQYLQDKKQGEWLYWLADGQIEKKEYYQAGKLTKREIYIPVKSVVDNKSERLPSGAGILGDKIIVWNRREVVSLSYAEKPGGYIAVLVCSSWWPATEEYWQFKRLEAKRKGNSPSPSYVEIVSDSISFTIKARGSNFEYMQSDAYKKLGLTTEAERKQHIHKDPVTGLWRLDVLTDWLPNKLYWSYTEDGRLERLMSCYLSRDIMRSVCILSIYMKDYKAMIDVKFLDNLLPQWPAIEKHMQDSMYKNTYIPKKVYF